MEIFGKRNKREMLEDKLSNLEHKIEQIGHTMLQITASLKEHISKLEQRIDDLSKSKESKLVDNKNYALYLWFSEGGEGFADFENNTLTKTKKYYSESLIRQYLDEVLVNSHFNGCCRYAILDEENKEVSQGGVLLSSK